MLLDKYVIDMLHVQLNLFTNNKTMTDNGLSEMYVRLGSFRVTVLWGGEVGRKGTSVGSRRDLNPDLEPHGLGI